MGREVTHRDGGASGVLGGPQVDLMQDMISLTKLDTLDVAVVACAPATGIKLMVPDWLLEGVVDVLLDLAGRHVAHWLGDGALVVSGLSIVVSFRQLALWERAAEDRVAATGAPHCELGRVVGCCFLARWPMANVLAGVLRVKTIGCAALRLGQVPGISWII